METPRQQRWKRRWITPHGKGRTYPTYIKCIKCWTTDTEQRYEQVIDRLTSDIVTLRAEVYALSNALRLRSASPEARMMTPVGHSQLVRLRRGVIFFSVLTVVLAVTSWIGGESRWPWQRSLGKPGFVAEAWQGLPTHTMPATPEDREAVIGMHPIRYLPGDFRVAILTPSTKSVPPITTDIHLVLIVPRDTTWDGDIYSLRNTVLVLTTSLSHTFHNSGAERRSQLANSLPVYNPFCIGVFWGMTTPESCAHRGAVEIYETLGVQKAEETAPTVLQPPVETTEVDLAIDAVVVGGDFSRFVVTRPVPYSAANDRVYKTWGDVEIFVLADTLCAELSTVALRNKMNEASAKQGKWAFTPRRSDFADFLSPKAQTEYATRCS